MNDSSVYVGMLDGLFVVGENNGDSLKNVLIFQFQMDKEEGLQVALHNPMPFTFRQPNSNILYRVNINKNKFSFLINLDEDIEKDEIYDEIVRHYKNSLIEEQKKFDDLHANEKMVM